MAERPPRQRLGGDPVPRHHPLDLLRGVAALGIAACHWLASVGVVIESLGTFGVYLFFVLSALTMTMVYGEDFAAHIAGRELKTFYWNRSTRIVPLLAAVSVASFLLAPHGSGIRLVAGQLISAFLTGSGLFALQLPGYLSNSEGAWSLGIELPFYLVFPMLCLMTRAMPARRQAGFVLVSIVVQQMLLALLHRWATDDPTRFWDYYSTPLTFLPFFLVGLLIARAPTVRRGLYLFPLIGALAAIVMFSALNRTELFTNPAAYVFLTACASLAVLCAYRSALPRSLVGLSAFVGNISYALYLTHPFSLRFSLAVATRLGGGATAAGMLFFPLALAIAHLTFALYERPVRGYLRSLRSRDRPVSARAVPGDPATSYSRASE